MMSPMHFVMVGLSRSQRGKQENLNAEGHSEEVIG